MQFDRIASIDGPSLPPFGSRQIQVTTLSDMTVAIKRSQLPRLSKLSVNKLSRRGAGSRKGLGVRSGGRSMPPTSPPVCAAPGKRAPLDIQLFAAVRWRTAPNVSRPVAQRRVFLGQAALQLGRGPFHGAPVSTPAQHCKNRICLTPRRWTAIVNSRHPRGIPGACCKPPPGPCGRAFFWATHRSGMAGRDGKNSS